MKRIFLAAIMCIAISGAFSQTFMHGAGLGIYVDKVKQADANVYGTIIYSPRVNFIETETYALSIGIPLTFGFSGSYNYDSNYGSSGDAKFMFNAPVILNINFGRGSTKENENRFGYFAGAGFGYHYGAREEAYYDDYHESSSFSSYGPAANAGLRFGVGQRHRNIEVLFSYMKGIDDSKADVFGLSSLFNF